MSPIEIRSENETDRPAIFDVEAAAFGQPVQAQLVDALRDAARPFVSLVAEHEGRVVGHISFSPVSFDAPDAPMCCQLSPLAVLPEHQRRGVGAALVHAGLEAASETGWRAAFLLGNPNYYARFGFEMATGRGLVHSGPDGEWLQCVEIERSALANVAGEVHFHPVFSDFE